MKKSLQQFLVCTFLLVSLNVSAGGVQSFEKYFKLLPYPQKIDLLPGKGFLFTDLMAIHLEGITKIPLVDYPVNALPLSDTRGKGTLTLVMKQSSDLPSSFEGYIMEIKNEQIVIFSRSETGLFYGCQTLLQLLEDSRDQRVAIPNCKITDFPAVAYRSVQVVLAHHLSAGYYYYQLIDRLARIKVNAIIFQFEDKLRFRKSPLVGAANAISIEEFAAISKYAWERHIEISPLVQGLGHAGYILKHDEYKNLREDPKSDLDFSPLDSGTYKLLFSLYEDAIAATPYGKYLHVGGDEVSALGTSEFSKKSGMNPFELQMYWLRKVCAFAVQQNRIPIFWDDMVFKLAGRDLFGTMMHDITIPVAKIEQIWKENEKKLDDNVGLFPKECIYMRWNYLHAEVLGNIKAIDWYNSHGLRVMAATAATSYPEVLLPRNNSNALAIKTFCQIAGEKKMEGILCTIWDDRSPHYETMWRGIYNFSLFSWNNTERSLETSNAIFRHRFYGPAVSDSSFEFQNDLEKALSFWDTSLVGKSRRSSYPQNIDLIDLPDPEKPGKWVNNYSDKLDRASVEKQRYVSIQKRINNTGKLARRNRYALAVMNQINELQIYSTNLLLLLKEYDIATDPGSKEKARQFIQHHVTTGFTTLRSQFEEVYSETRFLNNPEGYKLDQIHHLANGTNNNDWMFVFELAMNEKIKKWFGN